MSELDTPLTPAEVAQLLRFTTATLEGGLRLVPARLLAWHPAPGEWCVKEVVGHLIEAEHRGFAGRIRTILAREDPTFEGWDPDEVARSRRDCERDVEELLSEFRVVRDAGVALVEGLGPTALGRGGRHPKVGYLQVGDLLQEWAFHDQNHLRQILANLQFYAWPHMGSAQRFYREP